MRIVVFGATGGTGHQITAQALEAGHEVVACGRSAEHMEMEHERLRKRAVDILEAEAVDAALEGAQAVVVTVGGQSLGEDTTRSEGTSHVIEAMERRGIERLIVVSSAGVGDSISQLSAAGKTFVKTVIREPIKDHGRQEQRVRASDLDWTIARPGGLTDEGRTEDYQADPDGEIRIGQISRADLAHFVVSALEDEQTVHKTYGLSGA